MNSPDASPAPTTGDVTTELVADALFQMFLKECARRARLREVEEADENV
jgi:hypothetical protein